MATRRQVLQNEFETFKWTRVIFNTKIRLLKYTKVTQTSGVRLGHNLKKNLLPGGLLEVGK